MPRVEDTMRFVGVQGEKNIFDFERLAVIPSQTQPVLCQQQRVIAYSDAKISHVESSEKTGTIK